ncbi:MAG: S9 family peptidase [Nitriliruptoraceae bacterium]
MSTPIWYDVAANPPRAPKRPHRLERADGEVVDDAWYWLRERDDPEVLAYLQQENTYAEAVLAPLAGLGDTIFNEITQRTCEDDASAPTLVPAGDDETNGWVYYHRMVQGQQYAVHARRPVDATVRDVADLPDEYRFAIDPHKPPSDEVVLFDENAAAHGRDYFRLGALAISPNQRLVAEAADGDGAEIYQVRVRDLATGTYFDETIERCAGSIAWFDDNATFLYTVPDAAWRPHQVWRHRVGTSSASDELVLEERDERYWVGLGRTRSDEMIAIHIGSKITSEWRAVASGEPDAEPAVVVPRVDGVEVALDHGNGHWYAVTNVDGAQDFKLRVAPTNQPTQWRELVGHRPGVRLEGVDVFADHLVLTERTAARTQLRVCDVDTGDGAVLVMPDEVYAAGLAANPIFRSRTVRFAYSSLVYPTQVVDHDTRTGERAVIKQQQVRGGYDASAYESWREWATAADGTRIPISLVRRKTTQNSQPCLLYGYGSYEISIDPTFSIARLSLLDRGVMFAIAHVRGGGEMGRQWYEQGRLEHKANTFDDFIACADHLVAKGITSHDRLAIRGGSAGGLLVGAVVNRRPDVCAAAVAEVPFVDVVTTMSDDSIPLTVIEYDEWGNPAFAEYAAAMRAYSPYDNVRAAAYPAMFVTAGLNDPRVQYWEPAKWVAKLRDVATPRGPIVLKTELGAGHGGRSGRYDAWHDEADVASFVLATICPEVADEVVERDAAGLQ